MPVVEQDKFRQARQRQLSGERLARSNATKLAEYKTAIEDHEARIKVLEDVALSITDPANVAEKTFSYIKKAVPIIGTALVASGVASGKFGAFLGAFIKAAGF